MKILVDTHVHTVASGHAYSTMDEIARFAKSKNLEAVAITDHTSGLPGGAHDFYFANIGIVPDYIRGVRILKGVEANIIDYDGNTDIEARGVGDLEIVIVSLHPPCIDPANKEVITNTVLKAIEHPKVDIIGHPGDDRYPMDYEKVAKHAKAHNVLLEINNSSLKPSSGRLGGKENMTEMLKWCMEYETSIVLGTDSHYHEQVGEFTESIELLKGVNFPEHLIANKNLARLMDFINKGAM